MVYGPPPRVVLPEVTQQLLPSAGEDGGVLDHLVKASEGVQFLVFIGHSIDEEADLGNVAVPEEEEAVGRFPVAAGAMIIRSSSTSWSS